MLIEFYLCKLKRFETVDICTVFEINDGATLDDGKLKVLESGSHEYVVLTRAVSFEFKSGGVNLSSWSIRIVRLSEQSVRCFLVTTPVQVLF